MKKIFVVALLIAVILLTTGCGDNTTVMSQEDINGTKDEFSMFVVVEQAKTWGVVYDRETLCMYVVSRGAYNCGTFTLLVNPDGTPKLWEKK